MQLICYAEIRLVEHEATERDVAGESTESIASRCQVPAFSGLCRWERRRLRGGFWHARAINDHKCAGLAVRPQNESGDGPATVADWAIGGGERQRHNPGAQDRHRAGSGGPHT